MTELPVEARNFVERLERAHYTYRSWSRRLGGGVVVYVEAGAERWEVEFGSDGPEIEVFLNDSLRVHREPSALDDLFGRALRAWEDAASDLQIRFEPNAVVRSNDGRVAKCCGRLLDFGSPDGILVVAREDGDAVYELADEIGALTSGLNPRYYDRYERARFVELLSEWGYFGPAELKPAWLLPASTTS